MLISQTYQVKMQKEYPKVLQLFAAYGQTFAMVVVKEIKKDGLVHMNKDGKILFQKTFDSALETAGMLVDDEIILLQPMKRVITIVNLRTYEFKNIPFDFLFDDCCDQANVHTFSQKKYLCVEQWGMYNDNRLRYVYYNYPIKEGDKPINIYMSKDTEWTYEYHRRKANNHSMFVWFIARQDNGFEFRTYDFKDNPKGELKKHVFPNEIGKWYNINTPQAAINHIWQIRGGVFVMQCITNRGDEHINKQQGVINNNYVYDANTKTFREAKFYFKEYQQYLIDCMLVGTFSMFRTFQFKDGKALKTPVYYVDNASEEVIDQDDWYCTYLTKYQVPGYDYSLLCQAEYENMDVREFKMIAKKIINPKEIALYFLTQMNPEFDYNLLKATTEMIQFA